MTEKAKTNNGFIDQTEFKTADKYIFDTLVLNAEAFTVFDLYIDHIKPLFNPSCNFCLFQHREVSISLLQRQRLY